MKLTDSIRYLKGIGPKKALFFQRLNINTAKDLIFYFPARYEDRRNISKIKDIKEDGVYLIKADIIAFGSRHSFKKSFDIVTLVVDDGTARIDCVWFNQPYLKKTFKINQIIIAYGKTKIYKGKLQLNNPEFELIDNDMDDSLSAGRIVPVYPLTQGLSQRFLRKTIKHALDASSSKVEDLLPYSLRSKYNLYNLVNSLLNLHYPVDFTSLEEAKRRLSFEEFFVFQLVLLLRKINKKLIKAKIHRIDKELINEFLKVLPFELTESQREVMNQITDDLAKPSAMYRLLQGDVGSGKTIVALIAALAAVNSNSQVVFLVPTEILARQHYEKFIDFTKDVLFNKRKIKISLLTSSVSDKEAVLKKLKSGKIDIIIGTHALLSEDVVFNNLGLVVIDEQHKFGVGQRAFLAKKASNPDVLVMSATPIPRTMALTLYADMDISTIEGLPSGRKPVSTRFFKQEQRNDAYDFIKEELDNGRQAYIVFPAIEDNSGMQILSAKTMFEELKKNVFKKYRLALLHGRLDNKEQVSIMKKFCNQKTDILVATTILEVGIDVSNVTVMLIEDAQRFGLSQLHQLRGRIGRGGYASHCLVMGRFDSAISKERIRAFLENQDGFKIAQIDLEIRGQGDIFGLDQHGVLQFKMSDPLRQIDLLHMARQEAVKLLKTDPYLRKKENKIIKKAIVRQYSECVLFQVD
ncbi:MAG: ATP-dependent DNA helicase RecG [Candidatus Gygaella obscura]|nr:ATP-dependent DNA helicase RecG [Candidatus Gygaella obscura]